MFKPMLSGKAELDKLKFPLMASPKIDGIRMLIRDGVALSRSLKPLPNKHVQALFGRPEFNGLDGEIVLGNAYDPDVYVKTNSAVMSVDGEPDVMYWCFDRWDMPNDPFEDRYAAAIPPTTTLPLQRLEHFYVSDLAELQRAHETLAQQGFEGIMLRHPQGPYKNGRSTLREGWLLKLKTFEDAEGVIIGVQEEMANLNEATVDALGHTKRSTHKEGKVGKGTVGAIRVRVLNGEFEGVEVNIGSGFTAAQRAEAWNEGEIVTFKYMSHGAKDAPRHPVLKGRRHASELEAA